MVQSRW